MTTGTTDELLGIARDLLGEGGRPLRSARTAAAALVVRQALELAVDDVWRERAPAMADVTDRAQQITLPFFVGREVGDEARWAWSRLSHLCHHTAYEMPPTTSEVVALIGVVARLAQRAQPSAMP